MEKQIKATYIELIYVVAGIKTMEPLREPSSTPNFVKMQGPRAAGGVCLELLLWIPTTTPLILNSPPRRTLVKTTFVHWKESLRPRQPITMES